MEIIKNGCIKNWSPVFGQRPEGYGIEVTNFDNQDFITGKAPLIF